VNIQRHTCCLIPAFGVRSRCLRSPFEVNSWLKRVQICAAPTATDAAGAAPATVFRHPRILSFGASKPGSVLRLCAWVVIAQANTLCAQIAEALNKGSPISLLNSHARPNPQITLSPSQLHRRCEVRARSSPQTPYHKLTASLPERERMPPEQTALAKPVG
jgi:hypothetical protein